MFGGADEKNTMQPRARGLLTWEEGINLLFPFSFVRSKAKNSNALNHIDEKKGGKLPTNMGKVTGEGGTGGKGKTFVTLPTYVCS